jgi:hypothetical protein
MIGRTLLTKGEQPMKQQDDQVAMGAPLDAVRQAFEQWRNTRSGRERIPEELWQAPVDLSRSYSVNKIATELKLDYSRLRRRIQQSSPEPPPAQFIEVRMDHFLPSAQCTVHLRSPAGFEMMVELQQFPESA